MSGHGTPIPMTSHPCGPLQGEANVPGDKSISHRSLILGAMAVGETHITGLLEGEDVLDTAKAMRVDFHPAWDRRTYTHVAFNGTESGTRRVYVADLSAFVG